MSPEVLMAQNHSYTSDFFAIGVMLYEFMLGERPYNGRNRKEIREDVLKKQVYIKKENLPPGWKSDCIEFCNLLLMRKPQKRLGFNNGIVELKNNAFFKGFNWELLESKKMEYPFIPSSTSNFDKSFCEHDDPIYAETIERYQEYVFRKSYENLFDGYTYPLPGHGRGPICPPSASIDGYTLYFWDTCDFTIYIKEEEENGDEQVVYTIFVPASMTSTILPNNLFGFYIIEVVRDNQCFIGEIEL